ncbi:hypothetical protein FRC11_003324, partial [Ceratobasidium sp. 423]
STSKNWLPERDDPVEALLPGTSSPKRPSSFGSASSGPVGSQAQSYDALNQLTLSEGPRIVAVTLE